MNHRIYCLIGLWSLGCAFMAPAVAADLSVREIARTLFQSQGPVNLSGKDLSDLDLSGLDFKASKLVGVNLHGANLTNANFSHSDLSGAKFDRATMTSTDFSSAKMENVSIMTPSVFTGIEFLRTDTPKFRRADLKGARISARLDGADFSDADLSNAWIGPNNRSQEAGIAPASKSHGMDFTGAKLDGAEIKDVEMPFSKFVDASLRGARLINLDLSRADFFGADLTDADLSGCNLDGANLSGVRGFETVKGLASVTYLDRAQR